MHIVRAGLPAPTPQHSVYHDGEFVARVDLAWPEIKFAMEYDGQWHLDPDQLAQDRSRLRALNAAGWYVFHVTREDLHDVVPLMTDLAKALGEERR